MANTGPSNDRVGKGDGAWDRGCSSSRPYCSVSVTRVVSVLAGKLAPLTEQRNEYTFFQNVSLGKLRQLRFMINPRETTTQSGI